MPAESFEVKDHLNHRYFHKRAFYLAHLAAHLRKRPEIAEVTFGNAQGSVVHAAYLFGIFLYVVHVCVRSV